MRIVHMTFGLLVAVQLMLPAPVQAQQAINLSFGGFAVTGEDARVDGDVLFENRDILATHESYTRQKVASEPVRRIMKRL